VPLRGPDGEITGIVGVTRDMHEHKLMEDKLDQERNLLRTLIDNMPDFIYIKDRQSRFIINNKAHIEELGAKQPEEITGKSDFDFFPREYAQKYYDDEQVIMESGTPMVNTEEADISTEGVRHWLSTTKVPVKDAAGAVIGIVGISRDISERKQFEEALQQAKDELEVRVEERTADLKKANIRLEQRLSQLNFLTKASYELARYIELDKLFEAIVATFISRFDRAEASLCKREAKGFVCVQATPGLSADKARAHCRKALEAFDKEDPQTPIMIEDWTKDKWLKRFSWPGAKELPCYMAIPLLGDRKMISCLQIFTTRDFAEHFEREKPLLTTLSAHAAVCQSNAEYYNALGEQARLEGELEAARSIQRSYTPEHKPPIPHVNIKSVYYPAFEVGGDYLDYFQTEKGNWVVVVADVCGKGIPAALHMTVLRSTFRSEARNCSSARDLLCAVNRSMKMHLDNKSFVTALCLVITEDGTQMKYSRAGHPLLLRLGANGDKPSNISCGGVAIGLVPECEIFDSLLEEVDIKLSKGERFLVYTDGLTEALNKNRESYGFERLCGVLSKERSNNPDKVISAIMNDVKKFTLDAAYHDDLTMLALNVN
jgi:PAS domain S-box-containing protein